MIPAGILAQDTRDLSKEIWISWGAGYSQDADVYVNTFGISNTGQVALSNANGDASGFSFKMTQYNDGFFLEQESSGELDIINRNTLIMVSDIQDAIESYLDLTDNNAPRQVEIYVLRGRTAGNLPLEYTGWSKTGNIPSTASPVQSAMEVTNDWTKIGGLTTAVSPSFQFYASGISRIRAIVIKLL